VAMTSKYIIALNYTNYNRFPSNDPAVVETPYVALVKGNGFLFANWKLPTTAKNQSGLTYLQLSSTCMNSNLNIMSVHINLCKLDSCTFPSMQQEFPTNFSLTNNTILNIVNQIGFPNYVKNSKKDILLVTIHNPYSYDCNVTVDAYYTYYQNINSPTAFIFNSLLTWQYSEEILLYSGRYQPFRVTSYDNNLNLSMFFDLLPKKTHSSDLDMFFNQDSNDKTQNMAFQRPKMQINSTDQTTLPFPFNIPKNTYYAFSIYNRNTGKSSNFALSFTTGKISWGYWASIALAIGLVVSTIVLVLFLRPTRGEYEPLRQLSSS